MSLFLGIVSDIGCGGGAAAPARSLECERKNTQPACSYSSEQPAD